MQLMKWIVGAGLGTTCAVAVATATAICPAEAGPVTGLLVTVWWAGIATVVVLGGRRVRGELAWRRELRRMPALDTAPCAVPAPGPAQLRKSA
jgi:hypothetical protein